jgi:protein-disulfide isomerase
MPPDRAGDAVPPATPPTAGMTRPARSRARPPRAAARPRPASLAVLAAALVLSACSGGGGADVPRDPTPAPSAAVPVAAESRDSVLARADRARVQGSASAPVWMVVVSDFECPYCARWHEQSYEALKREYVDSGKIRIAYLNYPLPNHPHAMPAAEAAMCAGLQGKFWEMHDAIFQSQERWRAVADAAPIFESLAAAQGLDMEAHRRCLSTHETRPLIQADQDRVSRAGVTGTPTFFIGKRTIGGLGPTAAYRAALDSALAEAGGRP